MNLGCLWICLVGITPSNHPGTEREILPYMVRDCPYIALYGHWATPLVMKYNSRAREYCVIICVVPQRSWGNRGGTNHSKCLLLGGRRLNLQTVIPKPKGSGGARAATAQIGPANEINDSKRSLPVEASLRPGEAFPW